MRLDDMKLPTPEEIEGQIVLEREAIKKLIKSAHSEGDLNEIRERRRIIADLEDKVIISRNITEENAKAKAELYKEILKLKKRQKKDHKKLVELATGIIPLLESTQVAFPAFTDLLFSCAHQRENLMAMVSKYMNRYGGEEIKLANFPSIPPSSIIDYPTQIGDTLKRLRVLIPKPPEVKKEQETVQAEEVKSQPGGEIAGSLEEMPFEDTGALASEAEDESKPGPGEVVEKGG